MVFRERNGMRWEIRKTEQMESKKDQDRGRGREDRAGCTARLKSGWYGRKDRKDKSRRVGEGLYELNETGSVSHCFKK